MHIALLTDYPVVAFANGPSLATQALKRHLENRGHDVTIVGPRPGPEGPAENPGSLLLQSAPFRGHPGVHLPFAWPPEAFRNEERFDVVHSHANSLLMHWAPMMRRLHGIPCLSTNTVYLPGFSQYTLPEKLYRLPFVRDFWAGLPSKFAEATFARAYNTGDGLIVQCQGLADYWKSYGLQVPIHVIPRPIDTAIFDAPLGPDPFRPGLSRGKRIVSVSRHAREKSVDKLLRSFAAYVLPKHPDASLTLVGDGQEHHQLVTLAEELGIADRVDFPGEKAHKEIRDFCGHADVFTYASVTETYGQVVSEALWCGTPVVAIEDDMGVSFQVSTDFDGVLVPRGEGELEGLGASLNRLLDNPEERARFGANAMQRARARVSPHVVYAQYEAAYADAAEHLRACRLDGFDRRSVPDWLALVNRHVVPWTIQQAIIVTMGSLRGRAKADRYDVPKVRIDAMPEAKPTSTRGPELTRGSNAA